MKLPVTLLSFLVPSALSEALSPCSGDSKTPYSCPSGTEYHQSSVFAIIAAAAADVNAVTSDFFDTAWTLNFMTEDGVYNSTEQLTSFTENSDGGYIQTFEELSTTLPIEYISGSDFFAGQWVTFSVSSCFEDETAVVATVYACATGNPFGKCKPPSPNPQGSLLPFRTKDMWNQGLGYEVVHCSDNGAFFEKAWWNVSDILENQGKLSGQSQPPFVFEENGERFASPGCSNNYNRGRNWKWKRRE